ncbi:MAG TPA: hypothetical protein PKA05_12465 [Roseiflexaceae bacterium]|nr:hypothetical protein [Roseiflexaceae bacterium]HMP41189.1 hypothetical protein [Roseiflexaceae bacterium]
MASIRGLVALMLVALALGGCSDGPATPAETVAFASVCDRANDGKRVAVEGYVIFPDSFTESTSVILRMFEDEDLDGTPIGVQISFGTDANQVEEVADQYTDEDLRLHLADGEVVGYRTRINVSGKVYFPMVEQDFACGLASPYVVRAE